jgi:uncharacterized protein (TIGR02266 family)
MTETPVQKYPRYTVHHPVQLFLPSTTQVATLHNISLGGFFAVTPTLWTPGERVQAVVSLPHGPLTALCQVVHAMDPARAVGKAHPAGMGLRFEVLADGARSSLERFVGDLTRVSAPSTQGGPARANRSTPRWLDATRVVVQLSSRDVDAWWLRNLSHGGMFLETPTPPPRGTMLTIQLQAKGGVLTLQAEVVHTMDPHAAAVMGQPCGVGVQFVDMTAPQRSALARYLEGLTSQLHVNVSPPLQHAPAEHVMAMVRRFFDGLERQDGPAALGLTADATLEMVRARVVNMEDTLRVTPPELTAPQRARVEALRKVLPRVAATVEQMVMATHNATRVEPSRAAVPAGPPPLAPSLPRPAPRAPPPNAPRTPAPEASLADATALLLKGDLEAARDLLRAAAGQHPSDARLNHKLEEVEQRLRTMHAAELLASARSLAQQRGMQMQAAARAHDAMVGCRTPEILRQAMEVFLLAGDHQAVARVARDLLAADRTDQAPYQALLTVYEMGGHLPLALRTAETLLHLRPRDHVLKARVDALRLRCQ